MLGVEEMILVDPDILEIHNLNRLPFSLEDVGKPKVDVLASLIQKLRPDIDIYYFQEKFENVKDFISPMVMEEAVIVDAVDRVSTSNEIVRWAKKVAEELGILLWYLNINYDGLRFSVRYGDAESISETFDADDTEGYTIVPSFVGSAVLPALLGFLVHTATTIRQYYLHADVVNLLRGKINPKY